MSSFAHGYVYRHYACSRRHNQLLQILGQSAGVKISPFPLEMLPLVMYNSAFDDGLVFRALHTDAQP